VFDDEFNGTGLDSTAWTSGWWGDGGITGPSNPADELECYDPTQIVEGAGELDLNLTAAPETCPTGGGNVDEPYTSAMVTTNGKFSFTFGYVEARVWLPGSNGTIDDWPAIWADAQDNVEPQNGELDIMEGLGGAACWHFHDSQGAPGGCASGDFTGGWHTFGADWEPGIVTWYYDGVAVGSVTSGVTSQPLYLLMNLAVDHTYGGPVAAPATLRVDYIRVWQH
jgi:beta-glucanase (GH16 family)